jgi:hypothetical protein
VKKVLGSWPLSWLHRVNVGYAADAKARSNKKKSTGFIVNDHGFDQLQKVLQYCKKAKPARQGTGHGK